MGARFPYNAVSERTADRGKGGITDGKQDDLSRIEDPAYQDGCIDKEDGFRSLPDGMKVPFHSVHGGIPGKEGDKDHIHILLQYPPGDSIRHYRQHSETGTHLSYLANASS